eukprot:m.149898 g.149898  ORF g.149898 m.149898 type:complete len:67 (+) comp30690_c0_seq1:178-378(+)
MVYGCESVGFLLNHNTVSTTHHTNTSVVTTNPVITPTSTNDRWLGVSLQVAANGMVAQSHKFTPSW